MHAWRAPARVVATEHPDQLPDFLRNARPTWPATPDTPCPEQAKAFAMLSEHSIRFDDYQDFVPANPDALHPDPESPVHLRQPKPFRSRPTEDPELLSQGEML